MNPRLLVLCGAAIASVACAKADAAPPGKTEASAAAVPVLVELFTSEGCSSCPPADGVLASLERTQSVSGARIVPLALHVDYWDGIGWPDPFSSAQATQRQRGYASFGSGSYTPQAVVDGRAEMIGSRKALVEQAIAEAAKRPHATLGIEIAPRKGPAAPAEVKVSVGALPAGSGSDAEVLVALTQNAVKVAVPRGENAGKTLEHTAVTRQLVVAGAAPAAGASLTASLVLPQGLAAKELRVVAFVQERSTRKVLGTATRDLEAP